jgi:predicted nuclease of predicted toxin-antitoxin system
VRILLDENIPTALIPLLVGHQVDHVDPLGMKSVRNGELLAFARLSYDLFITLDRGILHQHNHRPHTLRILVLRVHDSRKTTVLARTDDIRRALETMPERFLGEI